MVDRTERNNLLLEEFRQAWEHYRHLENNRAWALGFLFTVALAGAGFIAKLLSEGAVTEKPDTYLFSCSIVLAVGGIAPFIYARIAKTAVVMRHYADAWRAIRREIYGDNYIRMNGALTYMRIIVLEAARLENGLQPIGSFSVLFLAPAFTWLFGLFGVWPKQAPIDWASSCNWGLSCSSCWPEFLYPLTQELLMLSPQVIRLMPTICLTPHAADGRCRHAACGARGAPARRGGGRGRS